MDPEDQKIVDITRELCQRLGISRINPRIVSWGGGRRGLIRLPPDQILFVLDTINLPKGLMGKLEPEEWKPVLCSSLIYQWKSQGKVALAVMLRLLPTVLLIALGLTVLDRIFFNQFETFRIILLAVYLPSTILGLLYSQTLSFRKMKRVWLDADRQAAEMAGPDNLLRALKKMESLTMEKRGRFSHLIRPTIQQRINHLQSLGPAWASQSNSP